jgi:membrane protein implicated in regulation of membrane protease activity
MRFQLATLLGLVTVLAVFCGIVFAVPLPITAILLALSMWISPAVWISGASYAQDGRQAFFRGGVVCGVGPLLVASYFMFMFVAQAADDWSGTFATLGNAEEILFTRLLFAGIWLAPGIFAVLGGAASYLTYRLVAAKPSPQSSPRLTTGDYQVVSGRLTTVAPEPGQQRGLSLPP